LIHQKKRQKKSGATDAKENEGNEKTPFFCAVNGSDSHARFHGAQGPFLIERVICRPINFGAKSQGYVAMCMRTLIALNVRMRGP
jgi:hypothetical protein